jgi:hypothetical protein
MTDIVLVALIGAVPATVAAISSLFNGRKTEEIHTLVNSNLDAVKLELAQAKKQIALLTKAVLDGELP